MNGMIMPPSPLLHLKRIEIKTLPLTLRLALIVIGYLRYQCQRHFLQKKEEEEEYHIHGSCSPLLSASFMRCQSINGVCDLRFVGNNSCIYSFMNQMTNFLLYSLPSSHQCIFCSTHNTCLGSSANYMDVIYSM